MDARGIVEAVINNIYASIACNATEMHLVAPWWPKYFELLAVAPSWREVLLHSSISNIAMIECMRIASASGLIFEPNMLIRKVLLSHHDR